MLRTSFSKYLAAFILVIFCSFVILSGIITMLVRNFAFSDAEDRLEKESAIIVDVVNSRGDSTIQDKLPSIKDIIEPMVNLNSDYDVIIIDKDGKVILRTSPPDDSGKRSIETSLKGDVGIISIDKFEERVDDDNVADYVYNGSISGLKDQVMAYAKAINTSRGLEGYVITMRSTAKEYNFVSITRQVVINSSIAVMAAAVIASYFITNRIVHPLKKMTEATKKFADGDFSTRVEVFERNNEVAELGKVDAGGGGTVAKYISVHNIDTVDLGVGVISMHAPYEVIAKSDLYMTYKALCAFNKF